MKPIVSILVGSGFSIPEKIPGVRALNQRLSKIDESEILIYTDQKAIFLNGMSDPNRFMRRDERLFLQKFLEFYNSSVLNKDQGFHYETFYDFYSSYLNDGSNNKAIEEFCANFNKEYHGKIDPQNRINDFNRSYNQLLASQLYDARYVDDISFTSYPPYQSFINFLLKILEFGNIKFHTLNHDLFFDWLGLNHMELSKHFSDGYQIEGSRFYGALPCEFNVGDNQKINKSYWVRLEQFTDNFDKALCYFKLHGSIDNKIVHSTMEPYSRIKDKYKISGYSEEFSDPETGQLKFQDILDVVSSDFLSGTTNKIRYYTNDPFYINLLNHFKENLTDSELLVVIGYGFQDDGINDYLEKYYLTRGKRVIVIDPYKPNIGLLEKYDVNYIEKGVTDVNYHEYLECIPEELLN